MTKLIFFDLWGTLVENGIFPSPSKQIWRLIPKSLRFGEFIVRFEKVFMTKKYDNLNKAFSAVLEEFKTKPDKELIDKMVGIWNKNSLISNLFPETEKTLKKLKKKYKIVLISNSDQNTYNVIEKFKLNQYFDMILLSYEHGLLKTDPELFKLALKKLKIKKTDAVMIGDSILSDMEGAKNAEIKGILIDRRDRRDYENKITSLSDLEKIL